MLQNITNNVSNDGPFYIKQTKRLIIISGAILKSPSKLLLYKDRQEEQTGTVHEEQLQQCKGDDTALALASHEGNYQGNLELSLLQNKKFLNGICFLLKAVTFVFHTTL